MRSSITEAENVMDIKVESMTMKRLEFLEMEAMKKTDKTSMAVFGNWKFVRVQTVGR